MQMETLQQTIQDLIDEVQIFATVLEIKFKTKLKFRKFA